MTRSWRIDSLDAAGGLAFASWRYAEEEEEKTTYSESIVTYYIAPPFFVPEPAPREIALAATRGAFQHGFYVRGSEHGFSDLAHVVEFVRRVYVGNEGGDGDPGTALGPPSVPLDSPGSDDRPERARSPLAAAFEIFAALEVKTGETARCDWATWFAGDPSSQNVAVLIYQALDSVQRELFQRISARTPEEALGGTRAWVAFVGMARRYLLPFDNILVNELLQSEFSDAYQNLSEIFIDVDSPYHALTFLPLPRSLREGLRTSGLGNTESLAQLLTVVMSSPLNVDIADYNVVAGLVFLCALAITSPYSVGNALVFRALPDGGVVAEETIRRFTADALAWCATSLPAIKFDVDVEDAIYAAARLPTEFPRHKNHDATLE